MKVSECDEVQSKAEVMREGTHQRVGERETRLMVRLKNVQFFLEEGHVREAKEERGISAK